MTKSLPAQEITLFRGLQVERRFEIGEEAFIAPYGELVDGGLLRERIAFPVGRSHLITDSWESLQVLSEASRGDLPSGLR